MIGCGVSLMQVRTNGGVPFWVQPGAAADLDFANGRYFAAGAPRTSASAIPGWSFTRSGSRYSDTSTGGLTLFGANTPRITDKGLAADSGATNLLTYSQAFDNAAWVKSAAGAGTAPVVTANDATAPDGTTTADRIDFDRGGATSGDSSQISQAPATSAGTYTGSIWLKAATGADVGKEIAIRHVGAAGYDIHVLTADWSRFEGVETRASNSFEIASRGTFSADQVVSLHAWGAQLETGSVATPSIPTTGATASAGADAPRIDLGLSGGRWANMSAIEAAGAWWTYCEFNPSALAATGSERTIFSITDTAVTNEWVIPYIARATGAVSVFHRSGGVSGTALSVGSVAAKYGTNVRLALNYDGSGNLRACIDGGTVASQTAVAGFAGQSLRFGHWDSNPAELGGYLPRFAMGRGLLTDAQLQGLGA